MSVLAYQKEYAFNGICPYYTMFPLEFPMKIISKWKRTTDVVFDPFCGRGTTLYAARRFGISAYGLDTSPIAAAIARSKLAVTTREKVLTLARDLLSTATGRVPQNDFFKSAYSPSTLQEICSIRSGLLRMTRDTHESAVLRATMLGCLHGPLPTGNGTPSYLSNQMPRTFSSKPDYSVGYWSKHKLKAPEVSVLNIIDKKLVRIQDLASESYGRLSSVKCKDARLASSYRNIPKVDLIITSPPYYGMRTYVQDQWLRMWFLGGPSAVDYSSSVQICHAGHKAFISDLAKVWRRVRSVSYEGAHLHVRFGAISSAESDPRFLLDESLSEAGGWKLVSVRGAHSAHEGKRQADYMGRASAAENEYDFHAIAS